MSNIFPDTDDRYKTWVASINVGPRAEIEGDTHAGIIAPFKLRVIDAWFIKGDKDAHAGYAIAVAYIPVGGIVPSDFIAIDLSTSTSTSITRASNAVYAAYPATQPVIEKGGLFGIDITFAAEPGKDIAGTLCILTQQLPE